MSRNESRRQVIENIRSAIANGDYYKKVETGDPVLTARQKQNIADSFLQNRTTPAYRAKSFCARRIADFSTFMINRDTEIVGGVDDSVMRGGVILTSNHFAPDENTVIRHFVHKKGIGRLHIVSQVTNFAMKGFLGFLMNYADTVPLSESPHYLSRELPAVLREYVDRGDAILIYPEQEMWYHYRKPRPPKEGAYYLAAKLGRPVVSCFVEIVDQPKAGDGAFCSVKYRLHVLGVLRPDPQKTARENSAEMARTDYAWKKAAYERIYGKPLRYEFELGDIAGWMPDEA